MATLNNIIFFIYLFCSMPSCKSEHDRIVGIKLAAKFDFVNAMDGTVSSPTKNSYLYKIGDTIIFFDPYEHISSRDGFKVDSSTTKYWYFIFIQNNKTGLRYNELTDPKPKIFDVDSLLKQYYLRGINLYNNNYYKLGSQQKIGDTTITQSWLLQNKIDDSYCDTTYYRFSNKFNSIGFFLSDTIIQKNYALVGAKMVYKSLKNGIKKGIDIPQREISIQITEAKEDIFVEQVKTLQPIFRTDLLKLSKNVQK